MVTCTFIHSITTESNDISVKNATIVSLTLLLSHSQDASVKYYGFRDGAMWDRRGKECVICEGTQLLNINKKQSNQQGKAK